MNEAQAVRNVRLYRWYGTLREPLMWGPILISSITQLGKMSLQEIYFMEAVVLLGFIFLEVPSGALADLIGRKKTVAVGGLFYAGSISWFACMDSPFDVWGANITWMVGASLCSGADTALLYDSLKEVGREHEYKQIEGAVVGNRLFLTALTALATGFLAEQHLRLPLLLSIPGVAVSAIAAFCFIEPQPTKKYTPREQFNLMRVSILFVANHKQVKWVVLFSTLIGAVSKVWFFTYNPYFELVDLDLRYYGLVFFLLNAVAWCFSRYAYTIERKVSEQTTVVLMVALIGIPMFVMGSVIAVASVGMVLLQNAVRGLSAPFFSALINRHLDSENRATVISVKSAVMGLSQFLGLGIFGVMLGPWSLPFCLQLLGITTLVLGTLGVFMYRKIFR